jgi:hypothetical protein
VPHRTHRGRPACLRPARRLAAERSGPGAAEPGACELCPAQVRAEQPRVGQISSCAVGLHKNCPRKIGPRELRGAEPRARQVRFHEDGRAEVGTGEVGLPEIPPGEILAAQILAGEGHAALHGDAEPAENQKSILSRRVSRRAVRAERTARPGDGGSVAGERGEKVELSPPACGTMRW